MANLKNGLSEPLEGPAYLEVGAGGSSGRWPRGRREPAQKWLLRLPLEKNVSKPLEGPAYLEVGAGGSSGW